MPRSEGTTNSDTHIPPPLDPFPTYQTPYPRNAADNENPFIAFRRFADEQLSSFFSGIPRMLGVPSTPTHPMVDRAPFEQLLVEQAARFRSEMDAMAHRHHEQAEGFRKQIEQEREERRMEAERLVQATRGPLAAPQVNKTESLRSGPGLDEPDSELDMYERLSAYQQPGQGRAHDLKHGTDQWRNRADWDVRRTFNQDLASKHGEVEKADLASTPTDRSEKHLAHLDPFNNDADLLAYLRHSKYSPINLMMPKFFPTMQDAPPSHSSPDLDRQIPERIPWHEAFGDLVKYERTGELSSRGESNKIWNLFSPGLQSFDAFRHPFWQEMTKMSKTSLDKDMKNMINLSEGEFWDGDIEVSPLCTGIMALLMGAALSGVPISAARESSEQIQAEAKKDNGAVSRPAGFDTDVRDRQHPADSLMTLIQRAIQSDLGSDLDIERSSSTKGEQVQAHKKPTIPDEGWPSMSSSSSSTSMIPGSDQDPSSVVSRLTTTYTRTLPDGSTETKTILKKRFADGREKQHEFVRVVPASTDQTLGRSSGQPPPLKQKIPAAIQDNRKTVQAVEEKRQVAKGTKLGEAKSGGSASGSGGGWFWN